MSTPQNHLTWTEKILTIIALIISTAPGLLFALWMPSREVGSIFGTLWGTILGAMITSLAYLRLHDRMSQHIQKLQTQRRTSSHQLPRIPSYTISPESSPSRAQHLNTPIPTTPQPVIPTPLEAQPPAPQPQLPQLEQPPTQQIHTTPIPTPPQAPVTQEEHEEDHSQFTTENLSDFVTPASASSEETFNEIARTTANIDVPGAVLMSMAQLDAELTLDVSTKAKPHQHQPTRQLNTPIPPEAHKESPQHFANRATAPLDANVINSFISDQKSTQRIENIPDFLSKELKRKSQPSPSDDEVTVSEKTSHV